MTARLSTSIVAAPIAARAILPQSILSSVLRLYRHHVEQARENALRRHAFADLFDRHDDHLLNDVGLERRDTTDERRKGTQEPWLTWVPWLV